MTNAHGFSAEEQQLMLRRSLFKWQRSQRMREGGNVCNSDICSNGGDVPPSSHQRLRVSHWLVLIQFEMCDNAFATATGFSFLVAAV